jgi:hypothetical protein
MQRQCKSLRGILKINGANELVLKRADLLKKTQSDDWVKDLYSKYCDNPKISWKDSINKIIGIERHVKAGLDI